MTVAYTPRTETVVILQGDDDERLRQLRAYAESLRPNPKRPSQPTTLDEGDPQAAYDEAVRIADEFAKEAEGRGITVVLRSLGRKAWRELIAKHPPRDDDEGDKQIGVNADTLSEDLVPACMASPVFGSDAERTAFLDSLSEAEFGRLGLIAWALNTRTGADPKAVLGSRPIPT